MSNSEKKLEKKFALSKLILDNRKELTLTGVEKVIGANQTKINVIVSSSNLLISGSDLHVSKLDVSEGIMEVTGKVNEIKYSGASDKSTLLRKIFK